MIFNISNFNGLGYGMDPDNSLYTKRGQFSQLMNVRPFGRLQALSEIFITSESFSNLGYFQEQSTRRCPALTTRRRARAQFSSRIYKCISYCTEYLVKINNYTSRSQPLQMMGVQIKSKRLLVLTGPTRVR